MLGTSEEQVLETGREMAKSLEKHYSAMKPEWKSSLTVKVEEHIPINAMLHEVKYIPSGEKVILTGATRDLGNGQESEVIYSDGTRGWQFTADLLD